MPLKCVDGLIIESNLHQQENIGSARYFFIILIIITSKKIIFFRYCILRVANYKVVKVSTVEVVKISIV
jgi:hypothetical protein